MTDENTPVVIRESRGDLDFVLICDEVHGLLSGAETKEWMDKLMRAGRVPQVPDGPVSRQGGMLEDLEASLTRPETNEAA